MTIAHYHVKVLEEVGVRVCVSVCVCHHLHTQLDQSILADLIQIEDTASEIRGRRRKFLSSEAAWSMQH